MIAKFVERNGRDGVDGRTVLQCDQLELRRGCRGHPDARRVANRVALHLPVFQHEK